jgi:hypothetical protein
MPADIAEPGSTQQGIAQGMQDNISIRVRLESPVVRHVYAAQHQLAAGLEGVCIKSLPDSHAGLRCPK